MVASPGEGMVIVTPRCIAGCRATLGTSPVVLYLSCPQACLCRSPVQCLLDKIMRNGIKKNTGTIVINVGHSRPEHEGSC